MRKIRTNKYFVFTLCLAIGMLLSGCFLQSREENQYSEITIRDGFQVEDYGESAGEMYTFFVYRMRNVEDEADLYWEIIIKQDEEIIDVLQVESFEHGDAFPTPENMVLEYDINFDGVSDILIFLGRFGNQGFARYKCYLSVDDVFIHSPSFSAIENPAVDKERCQILASWRNSASSHGNGIYIFENDTFLLTKMLTVNWEQIPDSESIIGSWTEEALENGEWVVTERFSEDELHAKVYGEYSTWAIGAGRWESLHTLHNGYDRG